MLFFRIVHLVSFHFPKSIYCLCISTFKCVFVWVIGRTAVKKCLCCTNFLWNVLTNFAKKFINDANLKDNQIPIVYTNPFFGNGFQNRSSYSPQPFLITFENRPAWQYIDVKPCYFFNDSIFFILFRFLHYFYLVLIYSLLNFSSFPLLFFTPPPLFEKGSVLP